MRTLGLFIEEILSTALWHWGQFSL